MALNLAYLRDSSQGSSMRHVRNPQMELGEVRIEDIRINLKSRDDIPALLLGLQHLYADEETRTRLFALLEEHMLPRLAAGPSVVISLRRKSRRENRRQQRDRVASLRGGYFGENRHSTRRARPERVEAYLDRCRDLVEHVQATLPDLALRSATPWELTAIEHYLGHAVRQIDHVERRLLKGETIP